MMKPVHLKSSLNLFFPLALVAAANAAPQSLTKLVPMPNTVLPVLSRSMPTLALSTTEKIEVAISLKPRDIHGLEAFADVVSDPNSPMYGHYISPEEVGDRYGASVKDVAAAKDFLTKGGLTVTHVGKNNMTIAATGTRAQVEALFGTKIGNFQITDASGSVTYRSNVTPLYVPSTLVDKIQSINGVETYSRPRARTTRLTPPLTRTLYNVAPMFTAGFKGVGRTVGISNWDGFVLNNGNLLIAQYNLPVPAAGAMTNVSVVPVGTGSQNNAAAGEGDLDFQAVLAVAPLANIVIYDGTGGNLTTVLSTEASANKAEIITESYGWNIDASTAGACHNTHLAMSAQGITYMCASGDFGTTLGPFEYPDYDPEVMMVGGTDATTDGSGNRVTEPAWSGSGSGWCTGAGANGSSFNVRPSWQTGNGVPTNINKRLVPDVALHATDYAIFYAGSLIDIGGTSASSPTWAGGLAIVEQRLFGAKNTSRLGRIQNKIYSQNGKSTIWFDVTTGPSTGTLPNGSSANPAAGWDFTTGWGAVDFNAFYTSLVTSTTLTTVNAQGVTPVAGTFVSGTKASLNEADGNSYSLKSQSVKGLGQVAGFNAVYTIPFTAVEVLKMNFTCSGPNGASAIISFQNNNTGAYDVVSTIGLTGATVSKTLDLTSDQIAAYVKSTGVVSVIVRAVNPTKSGQIPGVFTFPTDRASLAAAPKA